MPTTNSLAISAQERIHLANKDLEAFWLSRYQKRDPIARIGYAIWCRDRANLVRAIQHDPKFWNNQGFSYWEVMARTTVTNVVVGLERGGFTGNSQQTRAKIKEVGLAVAAEHAIFVRDDIARKTGNVAGLLSLRQIADYHHTVFRRFGIPAHFYGGTWLESIPDNAEFALYGNLYCHDCDASDTQGTAP